MPNVNQFDHFIRALDAYGLKPTGNFAENPGQGLTRFCCEGDNLASAWAVLVCDGEQLSAAFGHYKKGIHGHWRTPDLDSAGARTMVPTRAPTTSVTCLKPSGDQCEPRTKTTDASAGWPSTGSATLATKAAQLASAVELLARAVDRAVQAEQRLTVAMSQHARGAGAEVRDVKF